jgi:membrane protein
MSTSAILGPLTEPPPSSRSPARAAPEPQHAAPAPQQPASRAERYRRVWSLLKQTGTEWADDEASRLAASLALYTLLSIAPLVVIAVSVAGLAFGDDAARGQISHEISALVGAQAGQAIEALVANARAPQAGIIGTVVGVVVLLFGASGVFGELQSAMNRIWEVKPKPNRGIRGVLRDRFWSFSMVMGVAFLLLVSLIVSSGLTAATHHFGELIPMPVLWQALNFAVGLAVTAAIFALTFKVVPDVKIAWREVWIGGLATALAFSVGRFALSWYVGRSATVSPFGAAGSLVALVIWVYYSAQILFLGAEFTQVHARARGEGLEPTPNAVPLEGSERTPAGAAPTRQPQPAPAEPRSRHAVPRSAVVIEELSREGTPPVVEDTPTAQLLRHALTDASQLARIELALARQELQHDVGALKSASILGVIALASSIVALSALAMAGVFALGRTPSAALLVASSLLAAALLSAYFAWRLTPKPPLARTRQRLAADLSALASHAASRPR